MLRFAFRCGIAMPDVCCKASWPVIGVFLVVFATFEFIKIGIFFNRAVIFEVSAFSLRALFSGASGGISGGFGGLLGVFWASLVGLLGPPRVSWGALRASWGLLGELLGSPASPKAGYKRPGGPR